MRGALLCYTIAGWDTRLAVHTHLADNVARRRPVFYVYTVDLFANESNVIARLPSRREAVQRTIEFRRLLGGRSFTIDIFSQCPYGTCKIMHRRLTGLWLSQRDEPNCGDIRRALGGYC